MVKVEINLSKREILMLLNCIETAIDTKHMKEKNLERIKEIQRQLNKYL